MCTVGGGVGGGGQGQFVLGQLQFVSSPQKRLRHFVNMPPLGQTGLIIELASMGE